MLTLAVAAPAILVSLLIGGALLTLIVRTYIKEKRSKKRLGKPEGDVRLRLQEVGIHATGFKLEQKLSWTDFTSFRLRSKYIRLHYKGTGSSLEPPTYLTIPLTDLDLTTVERLKALLAKHLSRA